MYQFLCLTCTYKLPIYTFRVYCQNIFKLKCIMKNKIWPKFLKCNAHGQKAVVKIMNNSPGVLFSFSLSFLNFFALIQCTWLRYLKHRTERITQRLSCFFKVESIIDAIQGQIIRGEEVLGCWHLCAYSALEEA